jgi:hypothetical protein
MILVVDHDVSFLELASTILNRDRQVFLALDAKQAFQLAQHLGFSVALVDLDLKGKMACLSSSNCALISQTLRSSLLAASWVMTSSTPGTWALPRFCTSRLPPIGSRWSSGFESRESLEASGQYRIWWCRAYPTRGIGYALGRTGAK